MTVTTKSWQCDSCHYMNSGVICTKCGNSPQTIGLSSHGDLKADHERLRLALGKMIYEVTHLSPCEDDGSHKCRISAETLKQAREAYHD